MRHAPLVIKKLALRVATRGDSEAAQVLGDAWMERGLHAGEGIPTGRIRRVPYVVRRFDPNAAELTGTMPPEGMRIYVPAHEVLYNVPHFASSPTKQNQNSILARWEVDKKDAWRALVQARALPRKLRETALMYYEDPWASSYTQITWAPNQDEGETPSWNLRVQFSRRPPRSLSLFRFVREFSETTRPYWPARGLK